MENAQVQVKSFEEEGKLITSLRAEINKVIIGQEYMVDRIIMGLLTGGIFY